MNRAALDALLAAGLIDATQHAHALASRDAAGRITAKPALRLELPAASQLSVDDAAGADDGEGARTITGTVAVYEQLIPSHGMILKAGSLTPREPLSRVKLLRDHDHGDPLGYMTAFDPSTLEATFYVPAGDNGDRALEEAGNGLRDGLSVGFTITDYLFDEDYSLHVFAADFYETSVCAVPAIADAGVSSVAAAMASTNRKEHKMDRATLAAALAAGTITAAQHDAGVAALAALEGAAPADLAAGPQSLGAPTGVVVVDRPKSSRQLALEVATAAAKRDVSATLAALEGFVPEPAAGEGGADADFLGKTALGQIWQARPDGRPTIESLGGAASLESGLIEGWAWDVRPRPAKYAGKLADVPTNKPRTKRIRMTPGRWAGGWRLDRIFDDLGSPELVTSFWDGAVAQYQTDSDFDVAAQLYAAATVPTDAAGVALASPTTALGALAQLAASFRRIGASLDVVKLAEDVFEDFAELKIADLPAWLANDLGFVDLRAGTANVGDALTLAADVSLEDGEVLGYDRRAAKPYEKTPFKVEAIVVGQGAIDLGFYSYGGLLVNDARAIKKVTVS